MVSLDLQVHVKYVVLQLKHLMFNLLHIHKMKVSYLNWRDRGINYNKRIPGDYWNTAPNNEMMGRYLNISNDDFSVRMYSMYQFCCGLREIGNIYVYGNPAKIREEFITYLQNSIYEYIGALTYTRTKTTNGIDLQEEKVIAFIEEWPGATAGGSTTPTQAIWFSNGRSR
jgi:hypothetical protein